MADLKPCPFCGCEAKVRTLIWSGGYTATALCKNEPNAHYLGTWDEDEAKAVERITDAWNTRAERTCHIEPHGYCIANGAETSCRCWSCSECSYGWHVSDYDRQYRFCPNCGAKVVGE